MFVENYGAASALRREEWMFRLFSVELLYSAHLAKPLPFEKCLRSVLKFS